MTALQQEELPVETIEIQGRPYFVSIEPLMSVGEVATYTRLAEKTIYRAIEDGFLRVGRPRTKRSTTGTRGRVVVRRSDVDAWLFAEGPEPPPKPRVRRQLAPVEPIPVDPRSRRRRTA
jgi:excisionase family DNA binding protein